ncbi:hypothetical protein JL720_15289 [Aureococcus anophagefferens]|nr:hypothetical protein JL720_15289 [Aureococcus anophagefferens]
MLGSTLAEIAGHKAGVMRRGVTALTPATQPGVLRARAAAVGADLRSSRCRGPGAGPSTQRENRALVEAACAALGVDTAGLEARGGPRRIHVAAALLVDAAHNGDSVRRLLEDAAAAYPEVAAWTVVFGCGAEKEAARTSRRRGVLGSVESISRRGRLLQGRRRAAAVEAARGRGRARGGGRRGRAPGQGRRATPGSWRAGRDATSGPAAVLVCGSVYVAAEAREWAADRDPACLPADDWARVLRD